MSLSARIAVARSRRLDDGATVLASGGVAVAMATIAVRFTDLSAFGIAVASIAVAVAVIVLPVLPVLLSARRRVDDDGLTMIVSARPEVALSTMPEAIGEDWRLTASTVVWPGFVVIALRRDAAVRIVPLLDREVPPSARRALRRFLTWSLRGGDGPDRAPNPGAGPR